MSEVSYTLFANQFIWFSSLPVPARSPTLQTVYKMYFLINLLGLKCTLFKTWWYQTFLSFYLPIFFPFPQRQATEIWPLGRGHENCMQPSLQKKNHGVSKKAQRVNAPRLRTLVRCPRPTGWEEETDSSKSFWSPHKWNVMMIQN